MWKYSSANIIVNHDLIIDFINWVSKSIEDITELNNSNIPHLKTKIKQEWKLNDNVRDWNKYNKIRIYLNFILDVY